MKDKTRIFSLLTTILILFSSCWKSNPLDVDVSKIEVNVKIERLDRKLFTTPVEDLASFNRECLLSYEDLWETYISVMLRAGSPRDSGIVIALERFIHDPVMKQVFQDIDSEFHDLSWLEQDLETAFKHLKYYFPNANIPRIITYNSVFNFGVSAFQNKIGIGLEMYLGPENRTVKKISTEMMPQFVKDKMLKEYLVVDVMRGWFEANYLTELNSGEDFLTHIIYQGKIMYALDALLPKTAPHTKIRFTEQQYAWCLENENNIWKDIVDKKLLYSTNPNEIAKFIDEAPFTSGLPQNSPGRVGVFLGWQMVIAYMEHFPEKKLNDLVKENNPRQILKFYKPKK